MAKNNVCIMARPNIQYPYGHSYKAIVSYSPILHVNGREVDMYIPSYISDTGRILAKKFRDRNEGNNGKDKLKEKEIDIVLELLKGLKEKLKEVEFTEPNNMLYKIKTEVLGGK